MLSKVEIKNKAIQLRKDGLSYKEIQSIISVSKSTLSNWVARLELTQEQTQRLSDKVRVGRELSRFKASESHKKKRLARESSVTKEAAEEFDMHTEDSLFLTGIALYWAEGGKKSKIFQFVNSDPEMILLMVKWVEKFLKIPKNLLKYRLFIHKPYADENCEEFWSAKIGIDRQIFSKTIYKPTQHDVKKNPMYKGCLAVTITKINTFYKIMTWQKLLIAYYKDVLK
jgi:hypothetical protein